MKLVDEIKWINRELETLLKAPGKFYCKHVTKSI